MESEGSESCFQANIFSPIKPLVKDFDREIFGDYKETNEVNKIPISAETIEIEDDQDEIRSCKSKPTAATTEIPVKSTSKKYNFDTEQSLVNILPIFGSEFQ